jgi:protein-tyrosine-phosphatase
MASILIVGASDTGRSPIAAALLRRQLLARASEHQVTSGGVLGHDGDPASESARQTMEQMGIDIGDHIARSIDEALAATADLVVAIDGGVARVTRDRFPAVAGRVYTLGDLAGRARDIPDPFKMQIGAWLAYAAEIDALLARALPRMLALLDGADEPQAGLGDAAPAEVAVEQPAVPAPEPQPLRDERLAVVARLRQLIGVLEQMPGVVDWGVARERMQRDLDLCLAPLAPGDASPALAGMLRAALSMTPVPPSPAQLAALRDGVDQLARPVAPDALAAFSTSLAGWQVLR